MKKIIVVVIAIIIFGVIAVFISYPSVPVDNLINSSPTYPSIPSEKISGADYSNILVIVNRMIDTELKSPKGKIIGQESIIRPIQDEESGESIGFDGKQIIVKKPEGGIYTLHLKSPEEYNVEIYLYDKNGEVFVKKIKKAGEKVYEINFDKENVKNSSVVEE